MFMFMNLRTNAPRKRFSMLCRLFGCSLDWLSVFLGLAPPSYSLPPRRAGPVKRTDMCRLG